MVIVTITLIWKMYIIVAQSYQNIRHRLCSYSSQSILRRKQNTKKHSLFWQLLAFKFLSLILQQQKILMKHNNHTLCPRLNLQKLKWVWSENNFKDNEVRFHLEWSQTKKEDCTCLFFEQKTTRHVD